jgi:uncharacterized protein YjiK
MKKAFNIVVINILVGLTLLFWNNEIKAAAPTAISYINKGEGVGRWELPSVLRGVSGIKYLGDNRFACIQDEEGTIFIYNADAGKVEKTIPFSGPGDFEGIAIAGSSAYVVRSNGTIYEVQDYEEAKPKVMQYDTPLTAKHNVEGLTYDKNNNRLLVAVKGNEPGNKNYKGIYAFDLKAKQLAVKPVIKINLADPFFNSMKGNATDQVFQPSAIEIHPITNDIYILQGSDPRLIVMDAKGHMKKLYTLNRSLFPQAEGLAFTPKGELYVSNEGKDSAATIVKVTL